MIQFIISFLARLALPLSRVFVYILFGVAASITWLFQFLRLDKLPEPVKMIIKMFFFGMVITIPTFFIELLLSRIATSLNLPPFVFSIVYWFIVIAFVEELLKYLAVRTTIFKSCEFDEPVDLMIYMIVVALGFAALENILYLVPAAAKELSFIEIVGQTAWVTLFRFIGATFLHALCSGLVGFFMAISAARVRRKAIITIGGLLLVTGLHGLFNFSLMTFNENASLIFPIAILIALALFVILGFNKLRGMKSICKT